MALESATFFVTDCYDRQYKVHAIADSIGGEECLWCMVYKAKGCYRNERDMEYEEDYSADFNIHIDECLNLDDEIEIETIIRNKFNDTYWVTTWIDDAMIYVPTKVKKVLKEDMLARAEEYLEAYQGEWEGYEEALNFAEDGNTLAEMIVEYLKSN